MGDRHRDTQQPAGLRLWHWKAAGYGDPKESLAKPGEEMGRAGCFQHGPGYLPGREQGWEGTHPDESSEANLPRAEQPPGAARFLLQLF